MKYVKTFESFLYEETSRIGATELDPSNPYYILTDNIEKTLAKHGQVSVDQKNSNFYKGLIITKFRLLSDFWMTNDMHKYLKSDGLNIDASKNDFVVVHLTFEVDADNNITSTKGSINLKASMYDGPSYIGDTGGYIRNKNPYVVSQEFVIKDPLKFNFENELRSFVNQCSKIDYTKNPGMLEAILAANWHSEKFDSKIITNGFDGGRQTRTTSDVSYYKLGDINKAFKLSRDQFEKTLQDSKIWGNGTFTFNWDENLLRYDGKTIWVG